MYHSIFGAWTPPQVIQAIAAIFALLSAWAWAKSAMLQVQPDHKPDWLDRLLERISRNPVTWNAVAAFLAACAAVAMAIVLLITMPK